MNSEKPATNLFKWRWWDWILFFILAFVITRLVLHTGGVISDFGFGVFIGILYNFTIKRLWMALSPNSYQ
jgi:hypothetical protein